MLTVTDWEVKQIAIHEYIYDNEEKMANKTLYLYLSHPRSSFKLTARYTKDEPLLTITTGKEDESVPSVIVLQLDQYAFAKLKKEIDRYINYCLL